ncbi:MULTISPECIES: glycosyltransferase family 9 protein [Atlantibacter]|uniref:glycosyltransferase family 9 protein n=1 Tax=Atlantibacter TaxID=1903434 RepID=UPI001932D96B|nr:MULTISPECIES: glycosyltransferase family 9 protein [Atlantibacter]MBL7636031.1 glycosyltransferase family 9 protein [Atlantibacter hermannii]MBL7672651.1 glycosyltransferase family 9 protein [Atlantibacter hermannii]
MQALRQFNRAKNDALRTLKLKLLNAWLNATFRPQPWQPEKVKRVLLLRLDDKIGDMIVTTGTAKRLADHGYEVSVLTGKICATLLEHCDAVKQTYRYERRMSLQPLRQQRFDVVIDFDDVFSHERLNLLYRLAPRHVIGFNKPGCAQYTQQIELLNSEKHITERHRNVLSLFNLPDAPFQYYLGSDPNALAALSHYLTRPADGWLIAINPFTGSEDKDFSREQVQGIISFLKQRYDAVRVLLIGRSDKLQSLGIADAEFVPDSTINTAVEIVRHADLVISPDTSIVHMACTFNTPLVAVYNTRRLKDTGLVGYKIWAPNYPGAVQLVTETPAIGDMPLDILCDAVDKKLTELKQQRHQP